MSGSVNLTDPKMTSAQWAQLVQSGAVPGQGSAGGGQPAGLPSSQWGPFGATPPPGSPAALDFWRNLQYGDNPPAGAVPMDPSQYTDMYERMTANTSHFGGGMQIPVGVQGSQFNPSAGNPNFSINPSGYGVLTDTGQNNLANYAQAALQSIYANAAKNRASTTMGTILPLAFGGAGLGLGGLGELGLLGGAGAAGTTAGTAAGDVAAGGTSGVSSFLANPLSALGGVTSWTGESGGLGGLFGNLTGSLPSWVSPTLRGLSLLSRIASLAMQQNQGAGPTVSASGAGPTAGGR